MEYITITPNHAALFAGFLKDARNAGLSLRQALPFDPAEASSILRTLQRPLASLGVAAFAITSTEEFEQFRDVLGEIVSYVNLTAGRLENEVDEQIAEEREGLL